MNTVYLDNAASTKPSATAMTVFNDVSLNAYANPSSLHNMGMAAEKHIKNAKDIFAKHLSCMPKNIIFTSGGTESNNLAIIGYALANRRKGSHIITTSVEHPAVSESCKYLAENGFEVSIAKVNSCGCISLDEIEALLRDDTILVSVMHVNNEVGTIEPIDKLKAIMKKKAPNAKLHVDAVQGFGKEPIDVKKWGIDLLCASSHKLYAPKGTGLLYIADNVKLEPIIRGGQHQGGLRSGTENAPGIAAFASTFENCVTNMSKNRKYLQRLNKQLSASLLEQVPNIRINSSANASPYICNISFNGIRSEILLHSLESKGIYVSSGSACSSHKKEKSHVLAAMGLSHNDIDSAIRFGFSCDNTPDDIDYTIFHIAEQVQLIRKYTQK